ncbi:TrkA family potassium uptake protein [Oceanispirochaeta sp.]|jgi:trk system potassium uptake protein TrkA|uniref:potassium channel family protein n=1 Tax=Oceanispirochaeta sp. TaxID=2035350 RepID=UPI002628DA02|nr:TrkA family potassium uptake protein [Oceanispirochaeta sp.]MDA3958916.1 TrkA family potassium uptake protein [Oceanispirochaeta sp.]
MKKQLAIIGLSTFTSRILEQLQSFDCEILLIDKDPVIIEAYKDRVHRAFIADVLNEATIGKLIPPDIDAVIVDPGDRIEVSILVTNYLKKLGIKKIFVRAETDEHGEILNLIGANHVVYPNREAAMRLAPILLSSHLLSYMPLSSDMVLAEVKAPPVILGQKLIESGIRDRMNLNVVGLRSEKTENEYTFVAPGYIFQEGDVLLIAGAEKDVRKFSDSILIKENAGLTSMFSRLFNR